jgi:hypothetical protein
MQYIQGSLMILDDGLTGFDFVETILAITLSSQYCVFAEEIYIKDGLA